MFILLLTLVLRVLCVDFFACLVSLTVEPISCTRSRWKTSLSPSLRAAPPEQRTPPCAKRRWWRERRVRGRRGATGCGKSTLLNIAAGLLAHFRWARLGFRGRAGGLNRKAGYLFQADALMPWLSASTTLRSGSLSWHTEIGSLRARDRVARRVGSRRTGTAIRISSRAA